jgi:dihydroxyacetone kinase-like predicted kinase
VAGLSNRSVAVVPTRNAAEGLAALLALDPAAGAAENAQAMIAAARAIQSLRVTGAVRDAHVDGRNIRKGETIVLDPEEGLIAADDDPTRAVLAGVAALKPGFELLTLYVGEGSDLASAEELARRLREHRHNVEVEIVSGGQPFDRYLIAAE